MSPVNSCSSISREFFSSFDECILLIMNKIVLGLYSVPNQTKKT